MSVESMSVDARTQSGKGAARKLRAAGRLPGTLYGEGEPAQSIQLDAWSAKSRFIRSVVR
jgi:large subunit ribosomal protein L25